MMNRSIRKSFLKSYKKVLFIISLFLFMCVGYSALVQEMNFSVGAKFDAPAVLKASFSDDTSAFRSDTYKEKIKTITFEDKINVPSDAIESWDIGVNQNGDVMAYVVANETDSAYYDLYIQSNSQLYANKNMGSWFRGFKNADTINGLELLDTSKTTSMRHMFTHFGRYVSNLILDVSSFNTSNVTDMSSMFNNVGSEATAVNIKLGDLDTSNVTNMSLMFYNTGNTSEEIVLDLSGLDTGKVTDMNEMFRDFGEKASYVLDVSNFDTSNVIDMSGMFYDTGKNNVAFELDVSGFNTSKVTDMSGMFAYTGQKSTVFTLDVSNFDTSNVTNMNNMFGYLGYSNTTFTLDVSNFVTTNVTDMANMFYYTGYNSPVMTLDVSGFSTNNVTNMSGMFYGTGWASEVLHLDVSNFNTSNVTNMNSMFKWAGHENPNFTLDVSGFNTSQVTDMSDMFRANGIKNPNFTLDVSNFDTSNVTDMSHMFYYLGNASAGFKIDLGNWDTSKVTDMNNMFNGAGLSTIYVSDKWNVSNVVTHSSMFSNCSKLVGGAGTVFTSSVVDNTYARIDGGVDSPGYFTLALDGYSILNYIESSGTQYIDTGYSNLNGFKWDMAFAYTDEIISRYLIGSHNISEPYERNGLRYETDGGYWQLGLGDGYPTYNMSISLDTKYKISGSTVKGNNYVEIDGSRVIESANDEARSTGSILLLNNQYGLKYYSVNVKGKIYFVKLYDENDTLVRDYVPCKNSSGEYGLYDYVTNQFYGNSGTGDFVGR